ncbi:hypothetical protein GUJ93_ZPchr0015g6843 [Zizania palustris]|uniref:Uncharacterized protein n=1 Tax=Zizania palustris TaxID=103762 RepID=A0A8J5THA0_ZIZPA|nr:hypothetical protein GUJ93_ZPchr0015g6843 [Zizania palustris]
MAQAPCGGHWRLALCRCGTLGRGAGRRACTTTGCGRVGNQPDRQGRGAAMGVAACTVAGASKRTGNFC